MSNNCEHHPHAQDNSPVRLHRYCTHIGQTGKYHNCSIVWTHKWESLENRKNNSK